MTQGVETRLDGSTLVVRIPMRFQRRGGRKRIVAHDGSEIGLSKKLQADGALVKAPARAWRWLKAAEGERHSSPLPPLSGSQARSWALAGFIGILWVRRASVRA
jgi:hypothetical protein